MNKRNKGLTREEPRAQEWAERATRTYDEKNVNKSHKRSSDMGILISYKPKVRHYSYHTRAYYSLKYQKILWRACSTATNQRTSKDYMRE